MCRPRKKQSLPLPAAVVFQPLDLVEFVSVRAKLPRNGHTTRVLHRGVWTPRGVLETLRGTKHRVWPMHRILVQRVLRDGEPLAEVAQP
jgi:hypothetical protein